CLPNWQTPSGANGSATTWLNDDMTASAWLHSAGSSENPEKVLGVVFPMRGNANKGGRHARRPKSVICKVLRRLIHEMAPICRGTRGSGSRGLRVWLSPPPAALSVATRTLGGALGPNDHQANNLC